MFDLLQRLTARSFLLVVLVVILSTVLVWHGKISEGIFAGVVSGPVVAYIIRAVVQDFKGSQ